MFWRTIGRLLLVGLSFVAAAMVALAVLLTLGLEKITHAMHGTPEGIETLEAYSSLLLSGWALISGVTLLPALAVVIVGEVTRIRSWLYYMIGGGLSLAVIPLMAPIGQGDPATMPPAALWQVLATAGFAGGLVYWLLAGRRA
jgi:hypothetical protein